jgi:hypothetical protein
MPARLLGARPPRPGDAVRFGGRDARYLACLKRDAFAANHLVEIAGGERLVVKTARPLGALARRERAIYRRLAGIDGVPALGAPQGETWLTHAFVEGRPLGEIWREILREAEARDGRFDPRVPPDFYDRLEALVRAIHARGVIVLDLSKRDNIIVRPDGRPAVIDFQISLGFPARPGPLARRVFAALAAADLYQVWKHRRRHGFARSAAEARAGREVARLHGWHHRWLRDPWLRVRRRWLPARW